MDDTSPSAATPTLAPLAPPAVLPAQGPSVSIQNGRDSNSGRSNPPRNSFVPVIPPRSSSILKTASKQKETPAALPASSFTTTRVTRTSARRALAASQTPMPELASSHSPHTTLSSSSIAGPSTQPPLSTNPTKASKATKDPKEKSAKPAKSSKSSKTAKQKAQTPASDAAVDSQEGEWYAIKDIVDEKLVRGVRHYLIDWCNDPVSGKVYEKSWIPARDANKEAIDDWKLVKKALDASRSQVKAKPKSKTAKFAPVENSQSSYAESSNNVLTSQESQAPTVVSAESAASEAPQKAPARSLQRKRPISPSQKENADEDDEDEAEDAGPPPHKRRLVRGIRPDNSRALEPSQNSTSQGGGSQSQDLSQNFSQDLSQDLSQNQSQGPIATSSPPVIHEESVEPAIEQSTQESIQQSVEQDEVFSSQEFSSQEAAPALASNAAIPKTTTTIGTINIAPRPNFNPSDYIRTSQQDHAHLTNISRLALQPHGWMQPQSSVAFQFSPDHLGLLSSNDQQHPSLYHFSQHSNSQDEEVDIEEEDDFVQPLPHSGPTIPDSQPEDSSTLHTATSTNNSQSLFVDQYEDEAPVQAVPQTSQDLIEQPAPSEVTSGIPSQQQQQDEVTESSASRDAQVAPPHLAVPSQDNQQLRASADWASEEEPSAPIIQASANKSAASGSRSETLDFLTQPEPDFVLFTQESQQPSQQQVGKQTSQQTPGPVSSLNADSNNFSAVSVVPDSTRPIRVTTSNPTAAQTAHDDHHHSSSNPLPSSAQIVPPPLHSSSQGRDLIFNSPADFSVPRPSTPSQQPYRAPVALMAESPQPPMSAAQKLRAAMRAQFDEMERNSPAQITLTEDSDPLVEAEMRRMEQEIANEAAAREREQQQMQQQGSSQDESIASSSSNVLPVSAPLVPLADPLLSSTGALDVQPSFIAPQTIDATLPLLISPTALAQSGNIVDGSIGDSGDIHPGTIAPGDLSFVDADPMAASGLDLSPEPEAEFRGGDGDEAADDVDDVDAGEIDQPDAEELDDGPQEPSSPLAMEEDAADDEDDDLLSQAGPNFTTSSYVVTLPLAANTRQYYADLVVEKENERTIKEFSGAFSRDEFVAPSAETVARVDVLLRKLMDFSDLPTYYDSLPPMSKQAMMKHAVDTNSKYSFVHEFLDGISTLENDVLILVRKGVAMDYVEAIVSTAGIPVERYHAPGSTSSATTGSDSEKRRRRSSELSVVLADTTEMSEAMNADVTETDNFPPPNAFDIVIGFDHTARTTELIAYFLGEFSPKSMDDAAAALNNGRIARRQLPKPIVMLLVSAFTLEHIDVRLERNSVDDLERKNALLLCTLECLPQLRDCPPELLPAMPHEAAKAFADIVADPTKVLDWEPTPLPEDVFDIYMHSSGVASQPTFTQEETIDNRLLASRKRQLEDDGDEDGNRGNDTPKRMRLTETSTPIIRAVPNRFNDIIKYSLGRLDVAASSNDPVVEISLAQLEALASKVTYLESVLEEKEGIEAKQTDRLRTLDRHVKSQAATINDCQRRLVEAVNERGTFEKNHAIAVKEATATKEKLDACTASLAEVRTEKTTLETQLAGANALLAGSKQPDVAELGSARVALKEAQEKLAVLERKTSSADSDLTYARKAYQDASNSAIETSNENRTLKARIKELERLANDNLRSIHETNARDEAENYRRQWDEANTMLLERERELEWLREELRVLKNGRRETRQQSVPRSPRLSVISPRTVGRGSSVGVGNGGGASSSASVTPAPNLAPNMGGPPGAGYAVAARQSVSRGNSPVSANFDPSVYGGMSSGGNSGNGGNGGAAGGPPLPGMTYLNSGQGSGRWGHLRD
ncbi:hypothetical protein Sste5346_000458 [Sporothrix stenoceras]|uniref:Chromo domain-containing protein n=1 Tax=Sporothrix stenoceras TaxID=5173 RepID=A0ABR3ZR55_9PEZI